MPHSGCSALHRVNPNLKKSKVIDKNLINNCRRWKVQYIIEITTLKSEKYLSEERKPDTTCLPACQPA